MIRLLTTIGLALMTAQAFAQVQVPKSYSGGEVIYADDLNTNLKAIADAVPPRNCTTDQIIKWDDTNDVWVCATDVLAGLECEEEDTITFRNGTWQCSSATQPEEPCTTYYYDFDNDGYGTTSSQCLSSPTGYYTSTNATDCYDNNADANPAQTGFFSTHRGDGSYDYNCNGAADRQYGSIITQSCFFVDEDTCAAEYLGWTGNSIPSCGSTGSYLTGCEVDFTGSVCNDVIDNRPQTCQ